MSPGTGGLLLETEKPDPKVTQKIEEETGSIPGFVSIEKSISY